MSTNRQKTFSRTAKERELKKNRHINFLTPMKQTAAKAQALKVTNISSILKPNAFHMLKDVSLRFPFTHME